MSQGIGRLEERESDGKRAVSVESEHIQRFPVKLVLNGCGSWQPQSRYNGNLKDHWLRDSHNKIMKKFARLWDLPKCVIVSKGCWENGTNRLAWCRIATKLPFVKNAVSAKSNKWSTMKWSMPVLVDGRIYFSHIPVLGKPIPSVAAIIVKYRAQIF